jgi:ParB family chromosome partitioning protein
MTVAEAPTQVRLVNVPVVQIEVGQRHRIQKDVTEIRDSIYRNGLLSPITITHEFKLVAGAGRLLAVKELGWGTIPAFIRQLDELEAELVEITENLHRNDLTELELAEHLMRYEEILISQGERRAAGRYPTPNPVASAGVSDGAASDVDEFDGSTGTTKPQQTTAEIASGRGLGSSAYQRRLAIVRRIPDEVRDAIRDTEIANNLTELGSLSRLAPARMATVADMIASGQAKSVGNAEQVIDGPPETPPIIDTPGTDVGERADVVDTTILFQYHVASGKMRRRTINGEDRLYPREAEPAERRLQLRLGGKSLDTEDPAAALDFLCDDLRRQLHAELSRQGWPTPRSL